jgi:hypothetical protein
MVTLAVMKSDWLNIPSSDTTMDATIQRCIDQAAAEILALCRQPIAQATVIREFGPSMATHNLLPYHTVPVALVSLEERDEYTAAYAAVAQDVRVIMLDGLPYLWSATALTNRQYRLTLTVGYASGSMPADIVLCAGELATEIYKALGSPAGSDRFGVSAVTQAGPTGSTSLALQRMRERVAGRLMKYRAISI